MRKIIIFAIPILASTVIFLGVIFFLDRQSNKGALQVTSDPKSEVYLNNKLIGETPFCACELPQMIQVGDYSVKLVPNDVSLKSFEEKISVNKSTLTVVDRTFSKEGNSGSVITLLPLASKKDIEIFVESIPTKANIFLDSSPVGTTTVLLRNASEGGHDVRVTKDGFREKLIKIKTTLGYRVIVKLFLGSGNASSSAVLKLKQVLILDTPTGFLRVREKGSISGSEVGRVKPGETYKVLDENDGWIEIQLDSPAGEDKKGWISSQYAKKK